MACFQCPACGKCLAPARHARGSGKGQRGASRIPEGTIKTRRLVPAQRRKANGVEPLRLARLRARWGDSADGRRVLLAILAELRAPRSRQGYELAKRTLDLVVAGLLVVLLLPAAAAIAVTIRLDSRGPALFRQVRMGAAERPFRMLKFRTMFVDAHEHLSDVAHLNVHGDNRGDPRFFKAADDPRTTRVGRLLRRWAIDELPQLVNVLRGEMSLVGPRPLMLEEDRYVTSRSRERLAVRPGITGLWQILGRNEIPFDDMLLLDRLYAAGYCLRLDLDILQRTPQAIARTRRAV